MPWGPNLPLMGPVSGPAQQIVPLADHVMTLNQPNWELAWTQDFAAVVIDWMGIIPETSDGRFFLRTSSDGGATFDAGASDYSVESMVVGQDNLQTFTQANTAAQVNTTNGTKMVSGGANTAGVNMRTMIVRPFDIAYTMWRSVGGYWGAGASDNMICVSSGRRNAAERVDAIQAQFHTLGIESGRVRARGIIQHAGGVLA